jgi:hypothetical protein
VAFFEELSPYTYGRRPEPDTVNVGWLSRHRPFPRGPLPRAVRDRLRLHCRTVPSRFVTKGFHVCEFCGRYRGGCEMRVVFGGVAYAAPVLVDHYVAVHRYLPPACFVEAVLKASPPGSDEMLRRYGEVARIRAWGSRTDLRSVRYVSYRGRDHRIVGYKDGRAEIESLSRSRRWVPLDRLFRDDRETQPLTPEDVRFFDLPRAGRA